jgi:hypothetical protein
MVGSLFRLVAGSFFTAQALHEFQEYVSAETDKIIAQAKKKK